MSFGTEHGRFVVDLFQTGTPGPLVDVLHNPTGETGVGRPLIVGHNLKFDQKFLLWHYGIELSPVFDTFRASAMVYNGKKQPSGKPMGHDLWSVYRRELKKDPTVQDLGASNWSGTLTTAQLDYAADDVLELPRIYPILREKLAKWGMLRIAQIEFNAILPESAVELAGMNFDSRKWLAIAKDNKLSADVKASKLLLALPNPSGQLLLPGANDWVLNTEILEQWADSFEDGSMDEAEYAEHLHKLVRAKPKSKVTFNLASSAQVLKSLRMLGSELRDLQTTNEMDLAVHAKKYPVIAQLFDYRESLTALKSFGPHYLQHIRPETGRIHADYYPMLVGGRYAHSNPNLGQIPKGAQYRSCFVPPPGCKFVMADYSNLEMRLAAEISGDEAMIEVFRSRGDAHRFTASKVARKPQSEVTKEERGKAKPANFGFLYGMQWAKFILYAAKGYGIIFSEKEAQEFRHLFFTEVYPGLPRWHAEELERGKRTRVGRSMLGRIRHFDEQAHNEILNHPVQCSGADGLKKALRHVYTRFQKLSRWPRKATPWKYGLPEYRMAHHVHDEIVTVTPDAVEATTPAATELSEGMVEGLDFVKLVPIEAEAAVGTSWADKA